MGSRVHVNREVAAVEDYERHIHIHINITVENIVGSSLIIGGKDNRANVTNMELPKELTEAIGRALARVFFENQDK